LFVSAVYIYEWIGKCSAAAAGLGCGCDGSLQQGPQCSNDCCGAALVAHEELHKAELTGETTEIQ
jgi:hypothetical protein